MIKTTEKRKLEKIIKELKTVPLRMLMGSDKDPLQAYELGRQDMKEELLAKLKK